MNQPVPVKLVDPPEVEFEAHCRGVIEGLAGTDRAQDAALLREAVRRGCDFIAGRRGDV